MESYRNRYQSRDPSPDLFAHQTRGRVNFSSQDGFGNFHQPQYPESQPRRSRSADSRPQYNRGSTDDSSGFFSAVSRTSYRSGSGFSSSPSRTGSNRAHSDVGVSDAGMDSFRFHQIPKYEAVVHDDTMLYSKNERRRYRDGSSEDFLVLNSKSPAPARPGQATYHEQDRQYYNFAKENLITFGGFDAQTASTGLSQEELLARKQREEAFNKRKEKKKTKTKNRIINFPSSLRGKSQSPQRSTYSQPNEPQNQSSMYHKMSNLASFQSNGRGEDVFDVNDNVPNPNGYVGSRGKGIRGSMVRRHQRKSKKSNNFTMQVSTNSRPNSSDMDYDRGTNNGKVAHDELVKSPGNRSGAGKHTMYNTDHDYLLVQRDLDHSTPHAETTPRSRGSNPRPSYANFTPKSDYYAPRDLFSSKPYTKDTSPTSVMDAFGNSGGVRWNNNLTQEEFIITPQSTKLRPDSQLRNSSGKPKSILRSRYSSSNAAKAQNENIAMDHPFDENFRGQAEAATRGQGFEDNAFDPSGFNPDFMRNFVDQNGRDLSPIGMEPSNDTIAKFPDSYVQFIEAVAAVVIQTKVRQRLAKNKVQEMRNRRLAKNRVEEMQYRAHVNRSKYRSSEADRAEEMRNRARTNASAYQSSETTMTPMVRKSYALARQKVRQANQMKASKGRKDVTLDFYALAAIQIQAAFRGWWVRDCLGVDNFCAVMIQKIYRGFRCRREYLMDMNRIVTVQSTCRRWMAIDDAVTRIYCIVRIQAVMRGALVRKRMMGDSLDYYHAAATAIQTVWRSFWCEMTFLRAYEDILVVQSVVRGWLARKRFNALLQAKNNKFSQRRKPSTRFKSSRLPSSKGRNVGTYSNHTDYTKNNASVRSGKPELSKSQPSVAKKVNTSYSANRGSHSPWKAQNNLTDSNKGIETTTTTSSNPRTKSWKKPNNDFGKNKLPTPDMRTTTTTSTNLTKSWKKPTGNFERKALPTSSIQTTNTTSSNPKNSWKKPNDSFERNTIPAPPVNAYAGKSVSASRSDIERRRQEKEQERQARKEEENKRLESQNAGLAELELARRKMAWKKEEKLKQEQQNQGTKSTEDAQDSDYFDQVRNSNSAITQSSFTKSESNKVDAEKSEEVNAVAGGKEKSIVEKRREALMTSNGNVPSAAKNSFSAPPKSGNKSVAKAETKEVSPTDVSRSGTVNTQKVDYDEVPERTLVTKSTYQKDMAKLRSESEQKRIDYMHHIFNQAGLLSRVK